MAIFDVNDYSKVWKDLIGVVPSSDIGRIVAGDVVTGSLLGNGYASITSRNGVALVGYVRSGVLTLRSESELPPTTTNRNGEPHKPKDAGNYWVVRGDEELLKYDYQSRTLSVDWGYLPQTPSVFRFEKTARLPASDYRVDISPFQNQISILNQANKNKLARLYSTGTALFNRTGYPKQQYLVMSLNVLQEIAVEGGYLKFRTIKPTENVSGLNYQDYPQFVMRWDLVTTDAAGKTIHVKDRYGDIHWILSSVEGYGYIPLDWVRRSVYP